MRWVLRTITVSRLKVTVLGPARCKRGNLARVPRPWHEVIHGPPNNATCPVGDYETQNMMAVE